MENKSDFILQVTVELNGQVVIKAPEGVVKSHIVMNLIQALTTLMNNNPVMLPTGPPEQTAGREEKKEAASRRENGK